LVEIELDRVKAITIPVSPYCNLAAVEFQHCALRATNTSSTWPGRPADHEAAIAEAGDAGTILLAGGCGVDDEICADD
jgi:hypothetical protein